MSSRLTAEPAVDEILRSVCAGIRDALGFQHVLAVLREAETGRLDPRAAVGSALDDPAVLRQDFSVTSRG